jgi:iron-sulfur cluster assembly protein
MFTLTPAAAEQIVQAASEQDDNSGLRIAAKIDDEDGEMVYGMGFDAQRDDDLVLDGNGVPILISPHSKDLLDNTTLDFVEVQPGEFQFVFTPGCSKPTTAKSKGCGSGGCGSCS